MTIWRISVDRDSKNKIWKWAHQFMVDRFQLNKRIFFKVSKIAGFKRETFKTDYRTVLGKVSVVIYLNKYPHWISLINNRISLQGSKYKIMISGWKYVFFNTHVISLLSGFKYEWLFRSSSDLYARKTIGHFALWERRAAKFTLERRIGIRSRRWSL